MWSLIRMKASSKIPCKLIKIHDYYTSIFFMTLWLNTLIMCTHTCDTCKYRIQHKVKRTSQLEGHWNRTTHLCTKLLLCTVSVAWSLYLQKDSWAPRIISQYPMILQGQRGLYCRIPGNMYMYVRFQHNGIMEPCTCTPDSEIQCFYYISDTLMNLINGIFWGKSPGTSENLSPKTETLNCNPWSAKWYKVWKNKSGPLSCSLVDSKKLTTFSHKVDEWTIYIKIECVSFTNGCKILKIQNGDTKKTSNSMYFSFKIEYSNSQRNGFRKVIWEVGSYQSMHNIL